MKLLLLAVVLFSIGCSSGIEYPEGGYDYPKQVADKDTNFYEYFRIDSVKGRDSMVYANDYKFYKNFDEPNYSIKPFKEDIFRFSYSGFKSGINIITLSEKNITVKTANPIEDDRPEQKLSAVEYLQYHTFMRWFPIKESIKKEPTKKRYLDSLIALYPRLLDANYFQSLIDKSTVHFTYTVKYIPLSKKDYLYLVGVINASGFWSMKDTAVCEGGTDGDGYSLEANTKKKYKKVISQNCGLNGARLDSACQKLVDYAHMAKEIRLVWDQSKGHSTVVVKDVYLEEIKPEHSKKKHHDSKK